MKPPIQLFHFCPRCGAALPKAGVQPVIHCAHCGFVYYFNPTCAAGGLLSRPDGQVIFIRRASDPARGLLALPGGFIDAGENAEEALRREIREEIGLEAGPFRFVSSHVNQYAYRDVVYPVVDFFFAAAIAGSTAAQALDGVAELCWRPPADVAADEIAFPSVRAALRRYLE